MNTTLTRTNGTAAGWKVGQCAAHKYLGNCVIVRLFPKSGAAWVEVWGGPNGDKLMLFKGQRIEDLAPRG
jgi:hypothetical protein